MSTEGRTLPLLTSLLSLAHPLEPDVPLQQTSNNVGGDPKIRYFHSYWELKEDEALVIDATPPPCAHWNFQLNNYWMESLDYRYFPVSCNKHTAVYHDDGSVRIVVSHKVRSPCP